MKAYSSDLIRLFILGKCTKYIQQPTVVLLSDLLELVQYLQDAVLAVLPGEDGRGPARPVLHVPDLVAGQDGPHHPLVVSEGGPVQRGPVAVQFVAVVDVGTRLDQQLHHRRVLLQAGVNERRLSYLVTGSEMAWRMFSPY